MAKWIFNVSEGDKAISEEGTDDIVMYVMDVHPEVITKIVEMYNEEYSIKKIQSYLESDERVTPEEIEYLTEEIQQYIEKEKEEAGKSNSSAPFPTNLDEKDEKDPVVQTPQVEEKKVEKRVRTPRTISATSSKKKISIQETIEAMKEKMTLLEIIDSVETPTWPDNLSKAGRDIMIGFNKEYDALVAKYVETIQEM